jgi:hypothetical protein
VAPVRRRDDQRPAGDRLENAPTARSVSRRAATRCWTAPRPRHTAVRLRLTFLSSGRCLVVPGGLRSVAGSAPKTGDGEPQQRTSRAASAADGPALFVGSSEADRHGRRGGDWRVS